MAIPAQAEEGRWTPRLEALEEVMSVEAEVGEVELIPAVDEAKDDITAVRVLGVRRMGLKGEEPS